MPALGSLWYLLGIDSKQIDADLKSVEAKLKNLGVTVDVSKVRQTIEASVRAAPFNATVNFGNARASLDAIFANKKYDVHVEAIASKLHESIKNALANFSTGANILPKKKELRKAVNDALLSAGFEINIGKVKGLNATINNALGSAHTLNVSVDPKKLASAIDKAVGAYKGRKQVSVEVKDKILKDSITAALKTEKFPIRVIVDKAEAQDAVRQALQAAGLQSRTGFTASDKRAWDAQSRRMEAEARAAAASALAQRRLAGARSQAANAADKHTTATISLNSALKGNITLIKELGGAIGAAYSVVALKNFMTKVVEIGGELEKQKLAMKAILGDEGMANTISSQINTLAVKSPFGIMELNQYAKQLTAFQIPYNELYDTMKRMADVSAAVGVDMGRIILAYGQVRAAKFLKGTELRQFTEANIPLIDMLAERFTKLKGEIVSAGDIMDMISNKEVSFEDVKAVLWELTGEGGRFYNMQEVLSESVSAKWKNLADALDLMFADIAESTSGPLKGLAELLTALTSKWDYLGVAIASAAGVFGVAKVSTAAWNAALSKTTLSEIAQAKATKKLEAANLQVASTYRTLTAAEQGLIRTKGKLTAAQYVQLANTGKLTKEEALRLIALKKLDANSIGHIRTVLNISKQEVAAAQATKAWRVRLEQLKVSIKGFGSSIAAFFMNPVTIAMAAIGALMEAWYHMSEQSDKAEELGETLSTKAAEGARNLTEALRGLNGEFSNMNDAQLTQTIEKLEQLIKNYGLYAEKVLFYSYTDNKGVVRSMEERAEYLYEQAKALEAAYVKFRDWKVGDMVGRSADTWEFWNFNWDGFQTDVDDYADAVRNAQKELTKYLRDHEDDAKLVVKFAADLDPEFAELTKDMGIEQAMNTLVSDLERLQAVYTNFPRVSGRLKLDGKDFYEFAALSDQFLKNWTNTDVLHSQAEALKEAKTAFASLRKELLAKDSTFFDVDKWTQEKSHIMGMAFQEMFRNIEGLDYQFQTPFVNAFNEYFNIAFDPQFIEGQIQSQFSSIIPTLGDELAQKVRNGEQLEQAEKDKVKALFDTAVANVKSAWPEKAAEIQNIVDSNPVYANVLLAVNMRSGMDKWQQELDDAFGNNREITTKIKGEADTQSTLKAIAELKSTTKAALDKFALTFNITPNFGNLEKLSTDGPLTPFEKQQREEFNKLVDTWNDIAKGEEATGIDLDAWGKTKNKDGASQKDPLAESLKQRLYVLKKAYSEYKKELATMSKDAALERIKEAGIFDELFTGKYAIGDFGDYKKVLEKLLADAEASLEGLSEKDKNFKGRHDLVISLRTLLNLEIPRDETKEALDKAKREIDAIVSETTKKWDFYKALFAQTGDKETSMRIAFGENIVWTDATQQLQSELENRLKEKNLEVPLSVSDEEAKEKLKGTELYDLWKKVKDAIEKNGIDLRIDLAKATYEANSIAGKIKTQEGLRNAYETELRTKVPDITETEIAAALKPYNDKIEELKSSMLELLPIWEQIFGDHQYQSYGQIQAASDIAKQIIDNAKINKDANGKPVSFTSVYTDAEGNEQQIMGKISQLEKLRKAIQDLYKEGLKKNPFATLWENLKKVFNNDWKNKNTAEKLALIGESAAESAQLVGNLAGQLANLFEAAGNDSMGQSMTDVQDVMNSVSNIGKGFAQGGLVGGIAAAAGEAIGWVTKLFQRHDAKLQKMIDRSKQAAQIMQNQYDILEKRMANFLGNAANMKVEGYSGEGGAYGKQRELMQGQLAELEKQRQAEIDKKKTDDSVVADYDKQIEEMKVQIRQFAEEVANDLYGIDLKGWASELGDALFEAWKKGEDGAEAFKRKAGEILGNVMNEVLKLGLLEPMMEDVQKFLFGEDGKSGAFGSDFELTPDELEQLAGKLVAGMEGVDAYNSALDQLEKILNEKYGLSMKGDEDSKSGLSAGIQSLTEDTGSLVASYCNGIRGDVSVQTHDYWPRLLDDALPQMNVIAQSQLDTQRQIAENTLRNAVAAEAIQVSTAKLVELNDQMGRSWRRIAERNWGYS